jgi:hypothetical protein
MNKIVHSLGLDVHKEPIAVSIAPQTSTEVRRYGIIGGTLAAVDKLVRKLAQDHIELHVVYEAGPCGFVLCRHLRNDRTERQPPRRDNARDARPPERAAEARDARTAKRGGCSLQ